MRRLRAVDGSGYRFDRLVATGGIGWGVFFSLEENRSLGREESRPGRLLDARDYCKLHIVAQYLAVLLGAPGAGFTVHPVGRVGDDPPGRQLLSELESAGMCLAHLRVEAGAPTLFSACLQYPDGTGGNVTSSNSASGRVAAVDIDDAFESPCLQRAGRTIALAVPEVPLAARLRLLERGRAIRAFAAASITTAEAAGFLAGGGARLVELAALNAEEAAAVAGEAAPGTDAPAGERLRLVRRCAGILAGENPALQLVVTFGAAGCIGWERGRAQSVPAIGTAVASTAGAGDALFAGVLAGLACGLPFCRAGGDGGKLASALDLGTLLASLSVTSPHTIHPGASAEALREHARTHGVALAPALTGVLG